MEKYQSYKPSKIDWIGEIPTSWEIRKFRFLFSEKKSIQNLYLSSGSISFGKVIYKDDEGIPEERKETYQEVLKGEFLINPLNLNFDLKSLRIGLSEIDVVVSPGYIVLKLNEGLNKGYFKYLLRIFDTQQMKSLGNGVRQTISFKHLSSEELVLPSFQEQNQIVEFLDSKTELIDKLISTKERKITLLKEQRTSLINQVVTKGLNPNVRMKDSGIEWIGEIPEHWIKSKVKYVSTIFGRIGYRGYTVEDIVDEGEGVITISPSNIKNDIFTIEGENTFLSFEKYEESPEIQIFTDDIILVKTGSTIGKTSLIPSGVPKMTINPQLVVLKEIKIDNKYFYYQTVCEFFKKSFLVEQTGSSTPTISQEKINGFPILIPCTEEQQQIVEHLDSKTKEIDDLVQLEQKKIYLLKEYRQSLISEVVTGKVKVTQ